MADADDEDDMPIAELMRKRAAEKAMKEAAINASKPVPKATPKPIPTKSVQTPVKISRPKVKEEKREEKKVKPSSFDRPKSTSSSSGNKSKSVEFYENTDKGDLVQKLLVRWWYAIEWPKPGDYGEPPAGYEPLDGFKGVFVSTRVSLVPTLSFKILLCYCCSSPNRASLSEESLI